MLPISDVIPTRTKPWVTRSILAIELTVFAVVQFQSSLSEAEVFDALGLGGAWPWTAWLTAPVVHHGWLHLGEAGVALWIVGPTLEDRLGHGRFLLCWVLLASATAFVGAWAAASSHLPVVGSGGIVAGLGAGYLALFPRSRIVFAVPGTGTATMSTGGAAVLLETADAGAGAGYRCRRRMSRETSERSIIRRSNSCA